MISKLRLWGKCLRSPQLARVRAISNNPEKYKPDLFDEPLRLAPDENTLLTSKDLLEECHPTEGWNHGLNTMNHTYDEAGFATQFPNLVHFSDYGSFDDVKHLANSTMGVRCIYERIDDNYLKGGYDAPTYGYKWWGNAVAVGEKRAATALHVVAPFIDADEKGVDKNGILIKKHLPTTQPLAYRLIKVEVSLASTLHMDQFEMEVSSYLFYFFYTRPPKCRL